MKFCLMYASSFACAKKAEWSLKSSSTVGLFEGFFCKQAAMKALNSGDQVMPGGAIAGSEGGSWLIIIMITLTGG